MVIRHICLKKKSLPSRDGTTNIIGHLQRQVGTVDGCIIRAGLMGRIQGKSRVSGSYSPEMSIQSIPPFAPIPKLNSAKVAGGIPVPKLRKLNQYDGPRWDSGCSPPTEAHSKPPLQPPVAHQGNSPPEEVSKLQSVLPRFLFKE